jgi:stage V sporulation protein S
MRTATVRLLEALKVSTGSNPNAVAGAMAGAMRRDGVVEVTVVGAGALNQAVKAVAIARQHVTADGLDVVCVPAFIDVDIDGQSRTAIVLRVEHRPLAAAVVAAPRPRRSSFAQLFLPAPVSGWLTEPLTSLTA